MRPPQGVRQEAIVFRSGLALELQVDIRAYLGARPGFAPIPRNRILKSLWMLISLFE